VTASAETIPVLVRAFGGDDQILEHASANIARWRHAIRETDDVLMPYDTIAMSLSPCTFYRHRGGRREQGPSQSNGVGLLPKGSYGSWHYDSPEHKVIHVYLHPSQLSSVSEGRYDARRSELIDQLGVDDPVLPAIVSAINASLNDDTSSKIYIETMTSALSAHLIRHYYANSGFVQSTGGLSPRHVKQSCDYLAANVAQNITLAELASIAGMSPFHFCRAFSRSTGIPPHRYQIALRIERAKDLLANSTLSIAAISAAVGYDDQGQLARLFRKEVGISPSHYRRERRL